VWGEGAMIGRNFIVKCGIFFNIMQKNVLENFFRYRETLKKRNDFTDFVRILQGYLHRLLTNYEVKQTLSKHGL